MSNNKGQIINNKCKYYKGQIIKVKHDANNKGQIGQAYKNLCDVFEDWDCMTGSSRRAFSREPLFATIEREIEGAMSAILRANGEFLFRN